MSLPEDLPSFLAMVLKLASRIFLLTSEAVLLFLLKSLPASSIMYLLPLLRPDTCTSSLLTGDTSLLQFLVSVFKNKPDVLASCL